MENTIEHQGVRLISSRDAARLLGISHDYIGRLCKKGKVEGRLISGTWFVNEESLRAYLLKVNKEKYERREQLREELSAEYREAQKNLSRDAERIHEPDYAITDFISRVKKLTGIRSQAQTAQHAPSLLRKISIAAFAVIFLITTVRVSDASMLHAIRNLLPAAANFASFPDGTARGVLASAFGFGDDQPSYWLWYDTNQKLPESTVSPIANEEPSIVERVIEKVLPGSGISEALLNARLADLEQRLLGLIAFVPPGTTAAPVYYISHASGIGGGGFDDIDITNSTFSTGSVSDSSISGSTITSSTFTGDATTTNLYVESSFGFGTSTGLLRATSGVVDTLANGSNGQVLKIVSGNLAWGTDNSGGAGGGGVWATTTDDLAIYPADTTDVVIIGADATTTTGNILEVAGNSLFRNALTSYGLVTAPRFTATSSTASVFPYASTTALSATTLCLDTDCRTSWPTDGFSTTSSDYWQSQRNFFSTTSSDYWKSVNNFFSTTSASYFASVGLAFSTTSADYYKSVNNFFSTTSADYYVHSSTTIPKTYANNTFGGLQTFVNASSTLFSSSYASSTNLFAGTICFTGDTCRTSWPTDGFSTTSSDYWKSVNNFFSTTSADYWETQQTTRTADDLSNNSIEDLNDVVAMTENYGDLLYWNGTSWADIATSSLGLVTSSDLGAYFTLSAWYATTTDGLDEGSTNRYYTDSRVQTYLDTIGKGYFFSTTSADAWKDQRNFFSTTSSDYWKSVNNFFSTTSAIYFVDASTTIPKTYSTNVFTGGNTFSGAFTLGSLNGPLQANNGLVSATSSIGVLYGGTGLTSAPTFGQILVGNSSGGYTLTATSSLGLGFSTTSADAWKDQRNFFSTTSSDYWKSVNNFFSTTSADYWETQQIARTADDLSNNSIEDLNDVAAMTENYGDLLYWNGTSWADIATSSLGLVTSGDLGAYLTLSAWYATTTDGLDEGSTNRYYTDSRVQTYLDTIGKGYFFSTTSADAWKDQRNFFSTTSADYWKTENNFFSTTSALHFSSLGLAFSTTSADAWKDTRNFFSTTSADYWGSTKGYATFGYLFPSNATSTTLSFNNGLLSLASTTIGNGAQAGGLTISGGATTTGNLNVLGSLTLGTALDEVYGGTGQTSFTTGDILYASGANTLAKLPIGSAGQVLKITGGIPAWGADITSGGGGGATAWSTTTDSLAIYPTDTSDVLIVGNSATTTADSILEIFGKSYFSSNVGIGTTSAGTLLSIGGVGNFAASGSTLYSSLTLSSLTATSSLNVTGNTTLANATTTHLGITGIPSALLATNADGSVYATTSISSSLLNTSGNWTGTFDGQEGSYYLANAFSSTSANYWSSLGLGFSTTSADAWKDQRNFFSTTSSDYWKSVNNFFSTTSASYFASVGLAFSTTSADYYKSVNNFFSTTSADYYVHSSTTIPKTYANNTFGGLQTFVNASSTLFSSSYASSTNLFAGTICFTGDTCRTSWPTDGFSTTSSDYWKSVNNFFSTTSADYWETQQIARTADDLTNNSIEDLNDVAAMTENYGDLLYWNGTSWADIATSSLGLVTSGDLGAYLTLSAWYATTTDGLDEGSTNRYYTDSRVQTYLDTIGKGYFFSTTSADAWKDQRNFFSTTSSDYWKSVNNFFSTTSANYWSSLGLGFSTTSASYFLSQNQGAAFSTTSANYFVHSSTTIPKTYTNNTFAGLQTFTNASSTLFSSVYASTTNLFAGTATLGSLDLSSALAVAEGGTGASSFSYGLLLSPGGTAALTNIATSSLGLLTTHVAEGSNLYYTDGRVQTYLDSVNKGFFFSTTSADAWKDQRNFFSTTSADYYVHSSTTIPKTYSSNTFTGSNTFSGALTISGLNGPLQANNGLVSATTSIGVLYGGTGLTSAPTYGQILVGNASGGYTLTATSSLGLTSPWTTSGNNIYYLTGNVGIGTTSPYAKLSVVGEIVGSFFSATTTTATSTFAGGLNVGNGALTYDYSSNLTSIENLQLGALTFDADGGILSWVDMPVTSAVATSTVESYSAQIDGTSILTIYSESNGFGGLIATSTRVGISTTTPWAKLAIDAASGVNSFVIGSSTATSFIVDGSGRVGIGTTSPATLLSLAGSSGIYASTTATSTFQGGGINLTTGAGNTGCFAVNGVCVSADGNFSTTSADYWKTQNNFFSTTSSDYWKSVTNFFSTTSADFWKTANNFFSTSSADYWKTVNNFFSTTSADYYVHSSTTIPKTYSSNTFTGANTFNGTFTLGSTNGPLQANNGLVSATTSIGVLYGGTGLTAAPSYGNILVGNSSGGYTLTATSSLGLPTFGYLFPSNATSTLLNFDGGLTSYASSTIGNGTATGGLTVSGRATTTGNAYFGGNVGIGIQAPTVPLHLQTTGSALATFYSSGNQTPTITLQGSDRNVQLRVGSSILDVLGGVRSAKNSAATTNDAFILANSTLATTYGSLGADSNNNNILLRNQISGGHLLFSTVGAGNVGIGTTSPGSKLSIEGNIFLAGNIVSTSTATSTFSGGLQTTALNVTSTSASSTFANGIQLSGGCFRGVDGNCIVNTNTSAFVSGAGAGSTNRVAYWTDANTIASDADLSFDGTTLTARELLIQYTNAYLSLNDSDTTGTDLLVTTADGVTTFSADASNGVSGEYFAWNINNDEKVRLTETGRLGIGTTSPFAKLSIQASAAQTNPLFEIASTSNATKFLSVAGDGFGTTTLSGLNISGSATSTSNVGFNLTAGCYAINGTCLSSGSSLTGTTGQVAYFSGTNTAVGTSSLFIATSGNVGVGTTTPENTFVIDGGSSGGTLQITDDSTYLGSLGGLFLTAQNAQTSVSSLFPLEVGSLGDLKLLSSTGEVSVKTLAGTTTVFTSTGRVGIGTTTPTNKLTIADTAASQLSLSAGAGIAQWAFRNAGGNFFLSTTTVAGTATTSTAALSISGSGFGTTTVRGLNIIGQATSTSNVGFNITAGCYAINGTCVGGGSSSLTGTIGQVAYFSGTDTAVGTSSLFIDTNSNVGLGTTSPDENLHVYSSSVTRMLVGDADRTLQAGVDADVGAHYGLRGGKGIAFADAGDLIPISIDAAGATSFPDNNSALGRSTIRWGSLWVNGLSVTGGNVGIGTTSPGSLFSIGGTGTGWNFFDNGTTTSYAKGIDLRNGGCFAVNGTCVGGGSGSGTVGSGTTGQFPYYAADGTSLTATSSLFLSTAGKIGIGTTTPRGVLSLYSTTTASSVAGLEQFHTFNISGGGTSFANYLDVTNAPSGSANTLVGSIIRVRDNTALANTVRGLEVQANQGTNNLGENTAISGFGRTFGVRAVTEGDAGGVYVPSALFAETRGTTQGNAIRAYSSSITSADALVSILHDTSTFSGTGLLMNLANGSGSATGNLLDLQVNTASQFLVTAAGKVGIGTTTPWAKLSINSTAGMPQFTIGSSTTQFIVDASGNVGIGTTSPASIFSIQNVANFSSGTSTIYNNLNVQGLLKVGTSSIYLNGAGTSTFSHGIQTSALNITGASASSTFASGINITSGCFAVNGVCITGSGSGSAATSTGTRMLALYATSTVGTTTVNFSGAADSAPSFSGGTLTLPNNTGHIVVEVWGAGGGGGGSGGSSGNGGTGGTGGQSCFGTNATACSSPLMSGVGGSGGSGGIQQGGQGLGGSGGTATGGDVNIKGNAGVTGTGGLSSFYGGRGGAGGASASGGGAGADSVSADFGGGGGGGSAGVQGPGGGGGGGGGGYAKKLIASPASTYYFSLNAGGTAGTAGTGSGLAGSIGAPGAIVITVYATSTTSSSGSASLSGTTGQIPYFSGTNTAVGTSTLFLGSNSNFNIGTTSSVYGLTKAGQDANGWSTWITTQYAGGTGGVLLGSRAANVGSIQANNYAGAVTNLSLNSDGGNVGIGTTTPNSKLTVWGSSGQTDLFTVANSASTTLFSVINGSLGTIFNLGQSATTTVPNNTRYAWTIATSTTAKPLFQIDTTTGSEGISFGASGSDIVIGDVGAASNLVFEENAAIKGQGSGRTITIGMNDDIIQFTGSGTTTFSGNGINVTAGCIAFNGTCLSSGGGGLDGGEIYASTTDGGTGTWNAPAGLEFAQVIVTGGGGGGGGTDTSASAAEAGGGGGGAGATTIEMLTAVELGASQTFTIGIGGTAGADTGGTGGTGGATYFGTLLGANGGSGGVGQVDGSTFNTAAGGAGGTATTTGDVGTAGGSGEDGTGTNGAANGGVGGSSYWGGGGVAGQIESAGSSAGTAGTAFGSGGGGAATVDSTTGGAGGAGADGALIVMSYTASGGDLAEWYETKGGVEPGDVVAISEDALAYQSFKLGLQNMAVMEKAAPGSSVVGVVSTMPNQVIGSDVLPHSKDAKPVALAGRVPVKISEANGKIKAGDKLTMSNIPGVAMRATKAGVTIGKALEDSHCSTDEVASSTAPIFDVSGTPICKILILVNTSYSSGMLVKDALAQEGIELDTVPGDIDIGRILLAQSLKERESITASTTLSEIMTDRVVAGLEIISPRVVTDTLVVSAIEPVQQNVTLKLIEGGSFFIERIAQDALSMSFGTANASTSSDVLVHIDDIGNALFSGALTAANVEIGSANQPGGITMYDTATGEPFCTMVVSGQLSTVAGKCGEVDPLSSSESEEPSDPPAEEPPVEEPPQQEPPAEEPPAEEVPVEDPPEEAPIDESTPEPQPEVAGESTSEPEPTPVQASDPASESSPAVDAPADPQV